MARSLFVRRSGHAALTLGLLSAACGIAFELPEGAEISCRTPADCPEDFRCVDTGERRRCLPVGADDTPPSVVGTPTVDPPTARAGATVRITFRVGEPLAAAPVVSFLWPTATRAAILETLNADYVFTFIPDAAIDPEGVAALRIELVGANGLKATTTYPSMLTTDFTPPAVLTSTVGHQLLAGPGNLLNGDLARPVTAATDGTVVRVFVGFGEELDSDPALLVGGETGAAMVLESSVGSFYTFSLLVAASVPEGEHELIVVASDAAGNPLPSPTVLHDTAGPITVRVDRTAPAAPVVDAPGVISYTRIPWGRAGVPQPRFSVRGMAGAVEPRATVVCFDEVDIDQASEIGRTSARVDGSFGGEEMSAEAFQLNPADRRAVYLAAVDGAGNVSDSDSAAANGDQAAGVRDVQWVATSGRKVAGSTLENPHYFATRERLDALDYHGSVDTTREVSGDAWAGLADGVALDTAASGEWRQADYGGAWPNASTDKALVATVSTSALLLLEINSNGVEATRTYAEGAFRSVSDRAPPYRDGFAMAYDPGRRRAVLFGGGLEGGCGFDSLMSCGDTWEWDGESWKRVAITGPAPRAFAAMAYDSTRQAILLFGGIDFTIDSEGGIAVEHFPDTWAWDGQTWTQVAIDGPPGRFAHSMAADLRRGQLYVYGGVVYGADCNSAGLDHCSDTWVWDGIAWSPLPNGAAPPARAYAALSYDPGRGALVLFGGLYEPSATTLPCLDGAAKVDGDCLYGDTWELANGSWSRRSVTGPMARHHHTMAFDAASATTLLLGGRVQRFGDCGSGIDSRCNDLWEWNGTGWVEKRTAAAVSVTNGAGAFHEGLETFVFFGGFNSVACASPSICGNTWQRDASGWSSALLPGPGPRYQHAMAYDRAADEVVMFGGEGNGPCDGGAFLCTRTWAWDETGWHQRATTGPAGRNDTAMAYDAQRGVVVMFGGTPDGRVADCEGTGQFCGFTWEWSGSAWSRVCDTSPCSNNVPLPRHGHAMAYDEARQAVVMFGGQCTSTSNSRCDDDTWLWSGGAWTQACTSAECRASAPVGRIEHAMTYDSQREKIVLTGGNRGSAGGCYELGGWQCTHTWEWDGTRWAIVATSGPLFDRERYNLAYDGRAHRGVVVGPGTTLETWDWRSGAEDTPAHVARFSFAATGERLADVTPTGLSVSWSGGGIGYGSGAVPIAGTTLLNWQGALWSELTSGSSGLGQRAALAWAASDASDWDSLTDQERDLRLRRMFSGRGDYLDLALRPTAASGPGDSSGSGPRYATVSSDYVEVAVRYWR